MRSGKDGGLSPIAWTRWDRQGEVCEAARFLVGGALKGTRTLSRLAQASTIEQPAWGAEPFKAPKLGAGTLTTLSGTLPQASDSTYCRHPYPGPLVHSHQHPPSQVAAKTTPSRSSNGAPCHLPCSPLSTMPPCPQAPPMAPWPHGPMLAAHRQQSQTPEKQSPARACSDKLLNTRPSTTPGDCTTLGVVCSSHTLPARASRREAPPGPFGQGCKGIESEHREQAAAHQPVPRCGYYCDFCTWTLTAA